jgi:hypothetical protein
LPLDGDLHLVSGGSDSTGIGTASNHLSDELMLIESSDLVLGHESSH